MTVTTQTSSKSKLNAAKMPTGILKLAPKRSGNSKPAPLPSPTRYFWYTASDDVTRLATSSNTPGVPPLQLNTYEFDPTLFADEPYPTTFPPGSAWPPHKLVDLLHPMGSSNIDCVGSRCYTDTVCQNSSCRHSFDKFARHTEDWQGQFELRKTEDRGVGVFTKRAFKDGTLLGFYAGEIVRADGTCGGDYLMEMEIGQAGPSDSEFETDESDGEYVEGKWGGQGMRKQAQVTPPPSSSPPSLQCVLIDGGRKGNWTRFINHSCNPYSSFRIRRVGNLRIMAVEATRDIPAGVELTVGYGTEYYSQTSAKICQCGTWNCVGNKRGKGDGVLVEKRARVKKCKRQGPP